jgi:hypothetical protein
MVLGYNGIQWDTMGERIGRIGRIRTDFFGQFQFDSRAKKQKKSVRIRPIRSPIVSQNDPMQSISMDCCSGYTRPCVSTTIHCLNADTHVRVYLQQSINYKYQLQFELLSSFDSTTLFLQSIAKQKR